MEKFRDCEECERTFPLAEITEIGDRSICDECRPKLREATKKGESLMDIEDLLKKMGAVKMDKKNFQEFAKHRLISEKVCRVVGDEKDFSAGLNW